MCVSFGFIEFLSAKGGGVQRCFMGAGADFPSPTFFFFGSFAGLSRFGRSGTLFDRGDISGSFTDLSLLLNLLFSFSV